MTAAMKRKLNAHIEFVAVSHTSAFDPAAIVTEVLELLSFPEQHAILTDALIEAVRAWAKARAKKAQPEQMAFPDFPHVPAFIEVGRRTVGIEHATADELDQYIQSLKSRIKVEQNQIQSRLEASLQALRDQLRELGEIRRMVKRAARYDPEITAGEVMARRAEMSKKKVAG